MPVMGEIETTTQIRKLIITTPIIALTAHAFEKDKKLCLQAGMNDFTTKPLKKADLHKLIRIYTKMKSQNINAQRLLIFEDDKTTGYQSLCELSFPGILC